MARVAKPTKSIKPTAGKRKPAPKATWAAKPTKAAAPKRAMPAAAPTPKLNVAELRAYVVKLERSLATLRTKNREAGRAAKMDAARIAELEWQVGQFEAKAVASAPAAKRGAKPAPAPAARIRRQNRGGALVDVGGAGATPVSPGSETGAARESTADPEGE